MFSTCDLSDKFYPNCFSLNFPWRHFGAQTQFYGAIETVQCFHDNSKVKECLQEQGERRVLLIDGGCSIEKALMGDNLAKYAIENNWSGLVILGAIRDVELVKELPIGVMALGSSPIRTEKKNRGQRSLNLLIKDQLICPNFHIYADLNGVLISEVPLL